MIPHHPPPEHPPLTNYIRHPPREVSESPWMFRGAYRGLHTPGREIKRHLPPEANGKPHNRSRTSNPLLRQSVGFRGSRTPSAG
eukprot:5664052-Pyramimonas_sp.AAC.1